MLSTQEGGQLAPIDLRPLGELCQGEAPALAKQFDVGGKANLRRWRKERGYSQEKLAERADLHRTEIGLLENAGREPKFGIVLRLAGALEIEVGELYKGAAFVPAENGRGHFSYDDAGPEPN